MQVMLETLRLMMMVMVGRSHRWTHSVVVVLMVWRAPPMWVILGGMMLMRMVGGRQKACRRPRVHAGAVAGRSAKCCYRAINKCAQIRKYISKLSALNIRLNSNPSVLLLFITKKYPPFLLEQSFTTVQYYFDDKSFLKLVSI